MALLWPALAAAGPLDIPALGVRIPDLPASATAPKVVDKLIGYSASFEVGIVHVSVLRLLDPVPVGASLADRRYRSSMHEYLVDDWAPARHEEPVAVAGRDAWSNCNAEARAPDPAVHWHCAYYLISDQHLYQLSVVAVSAQKPPEFDAVVRSLYAMSFVPVQSPVGPDGRPSTVPRQLLFKPAQMDRDWYPGRVRLRGEVGEVAVEFSIDGQGHAQDLSVAYATSTDLTARAEDLVRLVAFRVPSGWDSGESRGLRFTFETQFAMTPCHFPAPHVADAPRVTICSSRLHY